MGLQSFPCLLMVSEWEGGVRIKWFGLHLGSDKLEWFLLALCGVDTPFLLFLAPSSQPTFPPHPVFLTHAPPDAFASYRRAHTVLHAGSRPMHDRNSIMIDIEIPKSQHVLQL